MDLFMRKLKSATVSEKLHIANKLRGLSPGANGVIDRLELEER
jgi:hypothetical protein